MREIWLILVGANSGAIITYFVGAPHHLAVLIPSLIASVAMAARAKAAKDKAE